MNLCRLRGEGAAIGHPHYFFGHRHSYDGAHGVTRPTLGACECWDEVTRFMGRERVGMEQGTSHEGFIRIMAWF
jgi:hypothetical protein